MASVPFAFADSPTHSIPPVPVACTYQDLQISKQKTFHSNSSFSFGSFRFT